MALFECPECRNMISDESEKCPHCGYMVSEHLVKCTECGNMYDKNVESCPNCGKPNDLVKQVMQVQSSNIISDSGSIINMKSHKFIYICIGLIVTVSILFTLFIINPSRPSTVSPSMYNDAKALVVISDQVCHNGSVTEAQIKKTEQLFNSINTEIDNVNYSNDEKIAEYAGDLWIRIVQSEYSDMKLSNYDVSEIIDARNNMAEYLKMPQITKNNLINY